MRVLGMILVATLIGIGASAAQQLKAGWIADPGTNCKVWNQNPIPNEHISWTGPCVDGIANGQGTLQWYANNRPTDRYVGELGNGRENGQGTYYWPEGARYTGAWKDGKAHGFGTRINAEGREFTGEWVDGCFEKDGLRAWVGVERADCGFR